MGPIGNWLGVLPLFKLTVLMMASSYGIWLLWSSYAALMVFAVVLGIAYGSRIAAVPGVLIEYFGLQNVGTVLGVFFTASGVSALLGPLLAGLAVDLTGGYFGGIAFALATGFLGFVAIAALRRQDQPETGPASGTRP
jgi:MFS family permease